MAHVEERLIGELVLDCDTHPQPVQHFLEHLIQTMAQRGVTALSRQEVAAESNAILQARDPRANPLARLLSEGLLAEDLRYDRGKHDYERVIRIGYERFASHLLVKHLLDTHFSRDNPESAFCEGSLLRQFVAEGEHYLEHPNELQALMLQLPERFGLELFDIVPKAKNSSQAREIFVDSVKWRHPDTLTAAP